MPRRSILSSAERDGLLTLPDAKDELIRLYTFNDADLANIQQHRGPANRLGFAVHLCYMRHPGILLAADTEPFAPLLRMVATDVDRYLQGRLLLLEQQLAIVNRMAAADELPDAIITASGLKITPLDATVPEAAQALIDQAATLLPHVKITELLMEVDEWTGFTRHFEHLKTGETAPDKALLLTAILADGINLGLTKMAESCPGTTYPALLVAGLARPRRDLLAGARRAGQRAVQATLRRKLGRWHHLIVGRPALQGKQQGREHRSRQSEIRRRAGAPLLHPRLRPIRALQR